MSRSAVAAIAAIEILDSRGHPTLKASCLLESGARGSASVPSGASTGAAEARELRDGDPARYGGLGCRSAVASIEGEIAGVLVGHRFDDQESLDRSLCELDGTPSKQRLGANAILAVSLAYARACAVADGVPLYGYLSRLAETEPAMPRPLINLYSGGAHAGGQVGIQDVQILVRRAHDVDGALVVAFEVYRQAATLAAERFGMRLLRADEGGLAPPFADSENMLDAAVESIVRTGRRPGDDVALAVDVAASQLVRDGVYELDGKTVDMVERAGRWLDDYPIASLEDPLAEEDWDAWGALAACSGDALLVGDDLLCTRVDRIHRAQEQGCANALLLKPNQVGTLTEALDALHAAREARWPIVVSARSGDTEDDWLADLAVGWASEHIKIGSITQSERLAKYNRLLEIEQELSRPEHGRGRAHSDHRHAPDSPYSRSIR